LRVDVVRRLPPSFLGASGKCEEEGRGNQRGRKFSTKICQRPRKRGGVGVTRRGRSQSDYIFSIFTARPVGSVGRAVLGSATSVVDFRSMEWAFIL
jgi:hypothetical protein